MLYPYPGYCDTGRTERTEVPGTGMNAIQNTQKFRTGTKHAVPVRRVLFVRTLQNTTFDSSTAWRTKIKKATRGKTTWRLFSDDHVE